jgi:hypothetical protein
MREEGLDAYHVSGDEFIAQFDDEAEAYEAMARVRERLDRSSIEAPLADGSIATLKGVGFSYGLGQDDTTAENDLQRDKRDREDEGARAARGEPPPALARKPAVQAAESQSPPRPQGEVTPPPTPETPAPAGVSASADRLAAIPPAFIHRVTVPVQEYHDGEGVKSVDRPASEALAENQREIDAFEKLLSCVRAA